MKIITIILVTEMIYSPLTKENNKKLYLAIILHKGNTFHISQDFETKNGKIINNWD